MTNTNWLTEGSLPSYDPSVVSEVHMFLPPVTTTRQGINGRLTTYKATEVLPRPHTPSHCSRSSRNVLRGTQVADVSWGEYTQTYNRGHSVRGNPTGEVELESTAPYDCGLVDFELERGRYTFGEGANPSGHSQHGELGQHVESCLGSESNGQVRETFGRINQS